MSDIILIIFLGIAVLIYFIVILPKKEVKKDISNMDNDLLHLNITIDRYNNLVQLFQLNYKKKKQEAEMKENVDAFKDIANIHYNFNQSCAEVINILEKAKKMLTNKKIKEYAVLLSGSEAIIEDMQIEMDSLLSIEIKDKRNEYKQNKKYVNAYHEVNKGMDLFAGCDSLDEIEKRYKALAKAFHPDTGHGDDDAFRMLISAYERKKSTL